MIVKLEGFWVFPGLTNHYFESSRRDNTIVTCLLSMRIKRWNMESAGITETYVILSGARSAQSKDLSGDETLLRNERRRSFDSLTLAQDDKSVRTPVIRNIWNLDPHWQLKMKESPLGIFWITCLKYSRYNTNSQNFIIIKSIPKGYHNCQLSIVNCQFTKAPIYE